MPVEDVFTITGRGTVATGRVERGTLHLNDEVEIIGIKEDVQKTVVTGIEMFRKLLDEAEAAITSVLCFVVSTVTRSREDRSGKTRHCYLPYQVQGSGLRSDQGRGWSSYSVLQQLSSAVLFQNN